MYDSVGKTKYQYVLINCFLKQIEGNVNQFPVVNDDMLNANSVSLEELKNYKLTYSLIELLKDLKIGFD